MPEGFVSHASPSAGGFSRRELDVLELVSKGMTNTQVADQLGITVHAIKFHLASIYRKLGVANRTEAAVAYAVGQANPNGSQTAASSS
ncbi:MAG TPA: helix-turn-helix transcriptional regulator [Gaiellaceae bacterium]|nr:helix-turn-helix transcriptional regulator [Gaiellaceae bacterium]